MPHSTFTSRGGLYASDLTKGLVLNLGGNLSYVAPKAQTTTETFASSSFATGGLNVAVEFWLSVFYAAVQYSHLWAFGQNADDPVAANIEHNNSWTFLLAIHINKYYLQGRLLYSASSLASSLGAQSPSPLTFDLGLGAAFSPL